jgi:hypothetical protein
MHQGCDVRYYGGWGNEAVARHSAQFCWWCTTFGYMHSVSCNSHTHDTTRPTGVVAGQQLLCRTPSGE